MFVRRAASLYRTAATSCSRYGRSLCSSAAKDAPKPFTFQRMAVIGAGKMAESILDAVAAEKLMPMKDVTVFDINRDRLTLFEEKFGVRTAARLTDAVEEAELVLFAVKPQNTASLFKKLHGRVPKDAVILSIIAGLPVEDYVEGLGHRKVVRSMPNTPATVRQGMTVWCCTGELCEEERDSVGRLLGTMGLQQYVSDQTYLDMATAVSGSGPAYVLLVIEALIDSSVHMGFPRDMATKLVLQTVLGTTTYAMDSKKHPSLLRNDITSPGGTTASALYVLERGAFRTVLSDGVWAAYRRSLELGGQDSNVGPGRSKYDNEQHGKK